MAKRKAYLMTWGNAGVLPYSKPNRRRSSSDTAPSTAGQPSGLSLLMLKAS